MRIAMIMSRSGRSGRIAGTGSVAAETVARLEERGIRVDVLAPEDGPLDVADLRPQHDLYVLKSKAFATLSLAGALTVAGAAIVNSYQAHRLAWDKVAATAVLASAGIPVPVSWATGDPTRLHPLLDDEPLWVKPQRGKGGEGVRRLHGPAALDGVDPPTDPYGMPLPLFAQREVPSDGMDFKVYVVGEQMWALVKPWPAHTAQDKLGTPVPLPPRIREAAAACGRALGLELFGADFLLDGDRFVAIDVNPFPGYYGVAEVARYLADYLYERARRPQIVAA